MKPKLSRPDNDFWEFQLSEPENALIIGGVHYRLGSTPYPKKGYGFGGSHFKIRMLDTGELIDTCDLWHQGTIPEGYEYKNNAEFVK